MLMSGLPVWLQICLKHVSRSFIFKADVMARTAWSGTCVGAFQIANIASPMNSSIVPFSSTMSPTMCSKYSLSRARTSTGAVFSHMVVKPAMSEKKILTLRRATPSFASLPSSRKCRTTSSGVNLAKEPTAPWRCWKAACSLRISKISETTTFSGLVTSLSSNLAVCDISSISWAMGRTSVFAIPSASAENIMEKRINSTTITVVKAIAKAASSWFSLRMS
mmetsp:Transcript_13078/g.27386  ORF Transcript_13078/g.27386 Transcript_13078/m.27386 type:complete len:221 (+) Transcript_13078:345-1007(+)